MIYLLIYLAVGVNFALFDSTARKKDLSNLYKKILFIIYITIMWLPFMVAQELYRFETRGGRD